MFGLGTQELLIVLVIVMVLFGAGKIPKLGSSLAKGITNFKGGLKDEQLVESSTQDPPDA